MRKLSSGAEALVALIVFAAGLLTFPFLMRLRPEPALQVAVLITATLALVVLAAIISAGVSSLVGWIRRINDLHTKQKQLRKKENEEYNKYSTLHYRAKEVAVAQDEMNKAVKNFNNTLKESRKHLIATIDNAEEGMSDIDKLIQEGIEDNE